MYGGPQKLSCSQLSCYHFHHKTQDSDLFRLGSLHVVIHDNEIWLGSLTVLRGGSPGRLFCGTEVFFDAFPLNRQSNLLSGQ